MRNLIIFLLLILCFNVVIYSQDKDKKEWKQKTFFKSDVDKGGYTGLSIGLSQIDNNYSYIVGIRFVTTSSYWIS